MKSSVLLAVTTTLVVLVAYSTLVAAVDRSKFKTCEQSGFCKRNREYAAQSSQCPYEADQKPERVDGDTFEFKVHNREDDRNFKLQLSSYGKGVIRVQVREEQPPFPRYEVNDVLLPTIRKVAPSSTSEKRLFGSVEIQTSPFQIRFFDGDELAVVANARGLFNIEHPSSGDEEADGEAEAATNEDRLLNEVSLGDDDEHLSQEAEEAEETEEDLLASLAPSKYRQAVFTDAWSERFGSHTDSKPKGPTSVAMDFTFPLSSHLFGIPEHATNFVLKPTIIGNSKSSPYRLYNLDVFEYEIDEAMALYGSVPLMLSHRYSESTKRSSTYGVFWLNAAETWVDVEYQQGSNKFDLENMQRAETHWYSESGIVDFFVLLGPTPHKVFEQYAQLTGTTTLPPRFSLAYHQCRWNYRDEPDIAEVNEKFDEFNLPMDVLWLDIEHTDAKKYFTWDSGKFGTPERMQEGVGARGRRMVTIVDPHIKREGGYYVHESASARGLYVKNADGNGDYEGWCWPGASMYPDFTRADVRQWWGDQFAYSAYRGSTERLHIWNDMNEPSVFNGPEVTMQKDLRHDGGWEHRDVHNLYGFYVHMATYDGMLRRDAAQNMRPFVLSRAFFAGSQRYGAIWTGDNAAQWSHLEASVPMLLSVSLGGISFSGADVGGFFGNPDIELLTRWYQAGAYQPFFRGHAHIDARRREPYLFDTDTVNRIRTSLRARYALLPYWYTQFRHSSISGAPVMRPLWVEYPTDSEGFDIEDQYLIGSDLLVKPVTKAALASTRVYFPGSEPWYDVQSFAAYQAPGFATVASPIDKIPVFQRGGSIISRQERPRRSSSLMGRDPYTLTVALNSQHTAVGDLYVDDGVSLDYTRGRYLHREFSFTHGRLSSRSIAANDAKYPIENVVERITILGLKTVPKKAVLSVNGGKSVDVEILIPSTNVVVLRNPVAPVAENWVISFEF